MSDGTATNISSQAPILVRMQLQVQQWEDARDNRALFLRCYSLMTGNMLSALTRSEFDDHDWVNTLLHHFAGYYFTALDAYERDPVSAPAVWQQAFGAARDSAINPLQKVLLGINAHINYDLVLALADVLEPDWTAQPEPQRAIRYADHCRVNAVIGSTIDAVQSQILADSMQGMALLDRLLGPIDELIISRLIVHWRETVWKNATQLLSSVDGHERAQLIARVEAHALAIGERIR
jgi:Family of unknown function (DUF5995)